MAARIQPLPLDEFHAIEEERGLPRVRANNLTQTLVHSPPLYEGWLALGRALTDALEDPRDRELVILRSAYRSRSPYEWGHHVAIAGSAGLSEEEILRVVEGPDAEGWSEADASLLRLVDELIDDGRVSDATWSRLAAKYGPEALLALLMLAGFYLSLAGMLASVGVEPESADRPALGRTSSSQLA